MSSSNASAPPQPTAPSMGVEYWQQLVREQQQTIEKLEQQLIQQQERIEQLEAELKASKKLKGKPKLRASQLNSSKGDPQGEAKGKRPGSAKASKKSNFQIDEERIIEPAEIPANAKFNGYRD